jgi:hypothetical protein
MCFSSCGPFSTYCAVPCIQCPRSFSYCLCWVSPILVANLYRLRSLGAVSARRSCPRLRFVRTSIIRTSADMRRLLSGSGQCASQKLRPRSTKRSRPACGRQSGIGSSNYCSHPLFADPAGSAGAAADCSGGHTLGAGPRGRGSAAPASASTFAFCHSASSKILRFPMTPSISSTFSVTIDTSSMTDLALTPSFFTILCQ